MKNFQKKANEIIKQANEINNLRFEKKGTEDYISALIRLSKEAKFGPEDRLHLASLAGVNRGVFER